MVTFDRLRARRLILAEVRAMARAFPHADYGFAREAFGLFLRVKAICGNRWPTARQCWEAAGLDRSHLVDEFEFVQEDLQTR